MWAESYKEYTSATAKVHNNHYEKISLVPELLRNAFVK